MAAAVNDSHHRVGRGSPVADRRPQAGRRADRPHRRHHALIFMGQNVTVEDVVAGEVLHFKANRYALTGGHHHHVEFRDVGLLAAARRGIGVDRVAVDRNDGELALMDVK